MDDMQTDHYQFLGLPSGEEGSRLTLNQITKAYKSKALKLHPDKRPHDPNAHANFQNLILSYQLLKDEKTRKLFDDSLRIKHQRRRYESKRRKRVHDLDEHEYTSFAFDPGWSARDEPIAKKVTQEAMQSNASRAASATRYYHLKKTASAPCGTADIIDNILKVTWDGNEDEYSANKLRDLFSEFGRVEDVVTRSTSALVVMATRDAAVTAMGTVCGDLSNPLLVLPLHKNAHSAFPTACK